MVTNFADNLFGTRIHRIEDDSDAPLAGTVLAVLAADENGEPETLLVFWDGDEEARRVAFDETTGAHDRRSGMVDLEAAEAMLAYEGFAQQTIIDVLDTHLDVWGPSDDDSGSRWLTREQIDSLRCTLRTVRSVSYSIVREVMRDGLLVLQLELVDSRGLAARLDPAGDEEHGEDYGIIRIYYLHEDSGRLREAHREAHAEGREAGGEGVGCLGGGTDGAPVAIEIRDIETGRQVDWFDYAA